MGGTAVAKRTRYGKRECSRCKEWKPLARYSETCARGVCKECQNAEKAKLYHEGKLKIDKERRKAQRRKNYALNPEREQEHAKAKRRRVKEDPERYARQLEMARMRYRMDQERKGRNVEKMKRLPATMVPESTHKVPLQPLVDAFLRSGLSPNEVAKRAG